MKMYVLFFFLGFSLLGYSQGFTISNERICLGDMVVFTDTNSIPLGKTVATRQWNYGDGVTLNSSNASVSYTYKDSSNSIIPSLRIVYSDVSFQDVIFPNAIRVISPPKAQFTTDKTFTCPNIDIRFVPSATQGSGGTIARFIMRFGDGVVQDPFNSSYVKKYTLPGSYITRMIVEDANGCKDSITKTLLISIPPQAKIALDGFACRDSVTLYNNQTANKILAQYRWKWITVDSDGSLQDFSSTLPVDFQKQWTKEGVKKVFLILTDTISACVDTSNEVLHNVDTIAKLDITPSIDTSICLGQSIQYTIRGSNQISFDNFVWGNRISGDSIILYEPKNTITYRVFGKTPNCPASFRDIKINVVKPLELEVNANPTEMVLGSKTIVTAKANGVWDSIRWANKNVFLCSTCDSTSASPVSSQYLKATLFYSSGTYSCSVSDSVFILIDSSCTKDNITIPTAFTPNGDEANDVFYPMGSPLTNVLDFKVYNRWGNLVYSNNNFPPNRKDIGWNGKEFNTGDDLIHGVYYYTISAECSNKQVLNFQGEITLIR
jgi:gliding motility-associated-like protein